MKSQKLSGGFLINFYFTFPYILKVMHKTSNLDSIHIKFIIYSKFSLENENNFLNSSFSMKN